VVESLSGARSEQLEILKVGRQPGGGGGSRLERVDRRREKGGQVLKKLETFFRGLARVVTREG